MQKDEQRMTKITDEANNISNVGIILDGEEWIEKEIKLQEKIFEHRKQALLIPNFFYKLCRTKQQKNEESIAENCKKVIENDPTNKTTN